jgi:hypothetical protein
MRLGLSKGSSRVGVFLPSPEYGNNASFRLVVFSSYFKFRTMDQVLKPEVPKTYFPQGDVYDKGRVSC